MTTPLDLARAFKADVDARFDQFITALTPALPPPVPTLGPTVPTTQLNAPTSYPTARTDRTPLQPGPLPTLPAAGGTFLDMAFNRPILRVTDAKTFNGRSGRCASSEVVAGWGRNSDRFFLMQPNGTVSVFALNALSGMPYRLPDAPFNNEPTFSRVSSWVLYGATGFKVGVWDTAVQAMSTLLDVQAVDPSHAKDGTYLGGSVQSSASDPERIAVFYGGTGQDKHYRVLVFEAQDTSKRLILDTQAKTLNGQPIPMDSFYLHALAIDQSGRYVILFPTSGDISAGKAQIYVWDLQTAAIVPITAAMFPYGHAAFGYRQMVNADSGNVQPYDAVQYQWRMLATVGTPEPLILPPLSPKLVYASDHPNWTNARSDGDTPFITATYRTMFGDATPWRACDNEVFAVSLSGSDMFRFCHHRSNVFGDGTKQVTFWYQPIPQVSPDGRYILFHSNMEKTLGQEPGVTSGPEQSRTDVFLIDTTLGG